MQYYIKVFSVYKALQLYFTAYYLTSLVPFVVLYIRYASSREVIHISGMDLISMQIFR